jgi:hypothetical protein
MKVTRFSVASLLVLGMAASEAGAQAPAPPARRFARMVVLAPRDGQERNFEEGYQRHLEWHRQQRDPWVWLGWSFVLGPRLGQFMDGTFGHPAGAFDKAVDPAADAADNSRNVVPYAVFLRHGAYEHLDSLSGSRSLPDTLPFLVLATYRVRPGAEARFESRLAALLKARSRDPAGPPRYAWLKLTVGGEGPEYLLLRSAPSWQAALELPDPLGPQVEEVASVTTELLRYRSQLSYQPPNPGG